MLDINVINTRYFDIKITVKDDDGEEHIVSLNVEPPKVKTLNKITSSYKNKDDENMMSEIMRLILNKNKTNYKVPNEIIENLDIDQCKEIFDKYSKWLNINRQDPN